MQSLMKTIPKDYFHYFKKKPEILFKRELISNNKLNNLNISLMTWNILASGYTSPHVYFYVNPKYLDENHRMNMISYDLLLNDCDIVCLQEVEKRNHEKYFTTEIYQQLYDSVYEKRPGLTCDGLAILYKKDKFKKIDYLHLNLNNISLQLGSLFNGVVEKVQNINLTHNICQMLLLEPSIELKLFMDYVLIVNLHLLWDPKKEIFKYSQMSEILNKIQEIVSFNDKFKIPVFICGDFNSTPNSNVYDLISNQFNEAKVLNNINLFQQIYKNTKYKERYYDSHQGVDNIYFTNIKPDFNGKLDYIFYTNGGNDLFKMKEISYIDTNFYKDESALPNSFHGSDHIYLTSKFFI
jgi:mRNA deadenylase 3'-5' endonuclease subunit Ccr4